jgi:prolipoprotein diacylglyceryltransferase
MTDDQIARIVLTPIGVMFVLWLIQKTEKSRRKIWTALLYKTAYGLGRLWAICHRTCKKILNRISV